ncbi:MAG TPA: N-acetylmuramidase family protein [Niabella sp.]|nr:N-acetylmuramidase family protein [Niabella sp.]HOZ97516.1 N-acetylmuramidase family protein [Niabella sp.]HQW15604.1 N-acetylmuramidase family protein [Niabella sp.]HQX20747.1 N-acetylmuramidase family protein [Niabella sp.]HQX42615.1 N-acetylmuramidase family protein [Niabella sp.]
MEYFTSLKPHKTRTRSISSKKLVENDFLDAARLLQCEVAAIKSVAEVESSGDGFLASGEPKILFERHIFSKRTEGLYDNTNPGISNRNPGGYGTVSSQHKRLLEAVSLNRDAGLMSVSWGKFQIMGFNFTLAGFNNLQDFVIAMYQGEREHLLAFVNYIINTSLDDELRNRNWKEFARQYNGPEYKKNRYDEKLTAAFNKFME